MQQPTVELAVLQTRTVLSAKLQSDHYTRIPNTNVFTDWVLNLLPNQRCQSTEVSCSFRRLACRTQQGYYR